MVRAAHAKASVLAHYCGIVLHCRSSKIHSGDSWWHAEWVIYASNGPQFYLGTSLGLLGGMPLPMR